MADLAPNDSLALKRLPASSILANYLLNLPTVAGLLFGMYVYSTNTSLWPGPFMLYVLGFLLVLRCVHPPLDWIFFQYDAAAHHLVTRSGWFAKTSRTIPWENVSVLDIEEPWAYRPFGLSHISVRAGGSEDTNVALEGVPREVTEFITGRLSHVRASSSESVGNHAPAQDSALDGKVLGGTLLYRATQSELIIACLAQGQFLVLGGGLAYGAYQILEDLGLSSSAMSFFGQAPLISGLVLGLCVVALGVAQMLMKYHAFEVRNVDGRVYLAYGLLSRHVREIRPEGLVGLQLRRNIFEMLADRVRLSLLTKDSNEQLGSNLMLPSLPRDAVQAFVETLTASYPALKDHSKMEMTQRSGRGSFVRGALLLALVAGLIYLVLTRINELWDLWLWVNVGLGIIVLVISTQLVQLMTARLKGDASTCHWKCSSVLDKELVVSTPAVHFVDTFGTRGEGLNIMKVRYFAGSARSLMAVTRGPQVHRAISSAVTAVSPGIARQNSTRLTQRHERLSA
ncbi:PH domain-containing protein [Neomicrococcus aestuarii]|uniref:YdbS-like PH domain-containing protein n=1 Tax=Neomicrococcus aestuarii TaxID=556325 RepID=A0A1L2ZMX4_9MICC|nr:PH domain-containing protein [Neomicrococcus aestuarii]APF40753.1 hypothetical protein BHE16_06730 [Neomicrococcus aestuarii]